MYHAKRQGELFLPLFLSVREVGRGICYFKICMVLRLMQQLVHASRSMGVGLLGITESIRSRMLRI
uniref:Uncharacterized protein n=1 Tax=Magnetococcus massalia (strain MO-1) TaxID=451514 RepID=A0A1S7LJR7_MAGMO|nr:protein of unknown function [Candidatus Magnetococcus massalia]